MNHKKTEGIEFIFVIFLIFSVPCLGMGIFCAKASVVLGACTINGKKLESGKTVVQGDKVRTGASGAAKFLLSDDSIVDLGPSTTFQFTQCEGQKNTTIDLALELGTLRAAVNKNPIKPREKFQIHTRSSVLAVRGTELFVSWELGPTGTVEENVGVSEGRVEITSFLNPAAAPLMLESGQQFQVHGEMRGETGGGTTQFAAKEAPRIDSFTEKEKKDFESEVKIKDPVFEHNVILPDAPRKEEGKESGSETSGFIFETVTGEDRAKEGPLHAEFELGGIRENASEGKAGGQFPSIEGHGDEKSFLLPPDAGPTGFIPGGGTPGPAGFDTSKPPGSVGPDGTIVQPNLVNISVIFKRW